MEDPTSDLSDGRPNEFGEAAANIHLELLPDKSRDKYIATYNTFCSWMKEKKAQSPLENVLLVYFKELSQKYAPNTLWSIWSMLRCTIDLYQNMKIEGYQKLKSFLRKKNDGYEPKKARVFSPEDLGRFLNEAPDETNLLLKLDVVLTLSASTSSDSGESQDNGNDTNSRGTTDHYDEESFDFEIRRVKERRAHEEVLSGKYRHPNYNLTSDIISLDDFEDLSSIRTSSNSDAISDSSPSEIIIPSISASLQQSEKDFYSSSSYLKPPKFLMPSISAGSASEIVSLTEDGSVHTCGADDESTENFGKSCNRSESFNSVQSNVSSLSLDSQFEESSSACYEFMKKFINVLFENSEKMSPELKSEFGKLAMTENGRMWFSRLISVQRVKSKRVKELTFFSLVQFFAIVLFECAEADDFTPAKNLMNMCFTFYHEVEVPGCEPYREYLYNYLREQPIWLSLRFWNAAFFDALQCERANRPIPKLTGLSSRQSMTSFNNDGSRSITPVSIKSSSLSSSSKSKTKSSSSSGSSASSSVSSLSNQNESKSNESINLEIKEDQEFQQNITFGQLGTFTCNMHAFGLGKDLCIEFLRKQCTIANLGKDQENMLRENICRMYKETDKWRE